MALAEELASRIAAAPRPARGALVVGLTGPQGSGKSTLAAMLPELLAARGVRTAVLALDDLYLPRVDRQRLAADVHPLFSTRGVPGTHDVALGLSVIESLGRPGETRIPRFDKGRDDRLGAEDWARVQGAVDVIVFEGWCVGARPQPDGALATPVNALERDQDPEGVWRRYANHQLGGRYQSLFAAIAFQILLQPPSFDVVLGWRRQQEHDLRAARGVGMTDAEVAAFIQHYERLTRWIMVEMPARAEAIAQLREDRSVRSIG